MVKCLNIGKNIGKPIYRSISITISNVYVLSSLTHVCSLRWSCDEIVFLEILSSISVIKVYILHMVLCSDQNGFKQCILNFNFLRAFFLFTFFVCCGEAAMKYCSCKYFPAFQ